jgi:hypothetical protein
MRAFTFRVDARDRITDFDDEWAAFACENGSADLPGCVVGTSLWAYIAGNEVAEVYRILMARVRSGGRALTFGYRCDSPSQRRHMEMTIAPSGEGGLEFRSRILRIEERDPVTIGVEPGSKLPDVTLCAWCKRVRLDGDWVEIEDAIRSFGDVDTLAVRRITHVACGPCYERLLGEIDRA